MINRIIDNDPGAAAVEIKIVDYYVVKNKAHEEVWREISPEVLIIECFPPVSVHIIIPVSYQIHHTNLKIVA